MLYREIIAVCSQIHTKHINTLCGQNVELLIVKLAVHKVATRPYRLKEHPVSTFAFPVDNTPEYLCVTLRTSDLRNPEATNSEYSINLQIPGPPQAESHDPIYEAPGHQWISIQ